MSVDTDRAATPARGVVQRSKHPPREHTGSRCGEGIASKVLQGMYAPACVRLRVRCTSGCAARGRQGEPSHATHVHPIHICTCAVCMRTCVQEPPHRHLHLPRPPATHFMSACHQIHVPSCRSALLQAFSTEFTATFVAAGDTVAGWPSVNAKAGGPTRTEIISDGRFR